MTLVLAGYYGVPVEKAEQNKREQKDSSEHFSVMRPVVEKWQKLPVFISRNLPQSHFTLLAVLPHIASSKIRLKAI